MRYEWDEDKRLVNIRKHNIDFIDVYEIFEGDIIIWKILAKTMVKPVL